MNNAGSIPGVTRTRTGLDRGEPVRASMGGTAEPVLGPDGLPYRVAVLIPTINNADELDGVLERLGRQTYPDFEIVISDSKSRDHTREVCEKHGVTWFDDDSTNRADACTKALETMDHDIVLFTDDDTEPPEHWVEHLVR